MTKDTTQATVGGSLSGPFFAFARGHSREVVMKIGGVPPPVALAMPHKKSMAKDEPTTALFRKLSLCCTRSARGLG